jgi:hypothetical protein
VSRVVVRTAYSHVIVRKRHFLSVIVKRFMHHVLCLCWYARILTGQVFSYSYAFMAMYSSVPPIREATFCGVPSCG